MKVDILQSVAICFSAGLLLLVGCNSSQEAVSKKDTAVPSAAQPENAANDSSPAETQAVESEGKEATFPSESVVTAPVAAPTEGAIELDALLDGDGTVSSRPKPVKTAKPKKLVRKTSPKKKIDKGELASPPPIDEIKLHQVTEHVYSVGDGEGSGTAGYASGSRTGYAGDPTSRIIFSTSEIPWQLESSNTESYGLIVESTFRPVSEHPLSTFSIDVDTASYSNMRRFLTSGQLPPTDAVRIEELVNYFDYNYPQPKGNKPFAANVEIAAAPWNEEHRLVRVGIQGRKIETEQRPTCNLVFLIDTSGSMKPTNKLPLVAQSMLLLTENLGPHDHVAIVTYAGQAGVLLPAVHGNEYEKIEAAIKSLNAGGSTNGSGGIQMAYEIARQNFNAKGVNRVILATDGDFNVGTTNPAELVSLIEAEAKSGVFLSVLGFGMGNYKDSTLESLADKGNGNYAYIDTINEGRKVLGEQMFGTLITIAKDVKIQIEFNPALVAAYRLIGYENRLLQKEDFNDDKKDAGEIGAGHTVTALYEIVPIGVEAPASVDPLKYQKTGAKSEPKLSKAAKSAELFTLKLRYKEPAGEKSKLIEIPVKDQNRKFAKASADFQFAASVASFGIQLRKSKFSGDISLDGILEIAASAKGADPSGYRAEFVQLVQKAKEMQP